MKKEKTVLVKVTKAFEVDPLRPRPKWYDKFIGETFRCYDRPHHWLLSPMGLRKLTRLRNSKSFSALIYKDCGEVVN